MKVAVIPARGGSKRIPRKNIRLFCGKPMLTWSVAAARVSGLFDRIIVSTDDDEIAAVAVAAGAEAPFRRAGHLSDDHATTADVIRDAVVWLQQNAGPVSDCCCIYPTAPMLQPDDLVQACNLLHASGKSYVFSAAPFRYPVQRALYRTESGGVAMFQPEHRLTRSQDLVPAFHDAGMFYYGRAGAWLSGEAIFSEHAVPLLLPLMRVQDIDTEEDWQFAEALFSIQPGRQGAAP